MDYEDAYSLYSLIRINDCIKEEYNLSFEDKFYTDICILENECNINIYYYLSDRMFWC